MPANSAVGASFLGVKKSVHETGLRLPRYLTFLISGREVADQLFVRMQPKNKWHETNTSLDR